MSRSDFEIWHLITRVDGGRRGGIAESGGLISHGG